MPTYQIYLVDDAGDLCGIRALVDFPNDQEVLEFASIGLKDGSEVEVRAGDRCVGRVARTMSEGDLGPRPKLQRRQ